MAHTPGPYIAITDFVSGVFWIETENDQLCLAEILGGDHDERLSGVCRDNANLFAAAPDLLEACKTVLDASLRWDSGVSTETIDQVRKAIAKAERK